MNLIETLKTENYSELKEYVNEEVAKKIAHRINSKKEEILNKLRGNIK
jgi:hypothetical protein